MRVNRLLSILTLAIVVLAVAVPTPATAQVDKSDTPIVTGTSVTVEHTFTATEFAEGEPTSVGGDGPTIIDDSVEFPTCCSDLEFTGAYDIDIGADRITMTWAGDSELARVIEAGTIEQYTFTFADANFKRAFADQSQLLAPDVTWTENTITVSITEGDEVGPGRKIVVLVTSFAPNVDGITGTDDAADETATTTPDAEPTEEPAVEKTEPTPTDAVTSPEAERGPPDRLPRTGADDVAWLALIGIALLGAGMMTSGVGHRTQP